jgi:hypothetical protein
LEVKKLILSGGTNSYKFKSQICVLHINVQGTGWSDSYQPGVTEKKVNGQGTGWSGSLGGGEGELRPELRMFEG